VSKNSLEQSEAPQHSVALIGILVCILQQIQGIQFEIIVCGTDFAFCFSIEEAFKSTALSRYLNVQ